MIPQRNISLLSNRLARDGGRRIPEAVLERKVRRSADGLDASERTLRTASALPGILLRFVEDAGICLRVREQLVTRAKRVQPPSARRRPRSGG